MKVLKQNIKDVYLKSFEQKMDINGFNKTNYLKNIKTAIICKPEQLFDEMAAGEYDMVTNTIGLDSKYMDSLEHELLHLSSTRKDKNHVYCGLSVINIEKDTGIGTGLNEGMTAYLDKKYFTGENADYYGCITLDLTKLLFNVIPEKEMIEHYFNGDVEGVFKKISAIIGYEHAYKLLLSLDDVYYTAEFVDDINLKEAIIYYKRFIKYYSELLLVKLFTEFYNNNIDEGTLNIGIEYVEDLQYKMVSFNKFKKKYLFRPEELKKLIDYAENRVLKKIK